MIIDKNFPFEFRIRLVALANGHYFGGGLQVLPDGLIDDSQMDVVWLEKIKLGIFIRHSPKVYFGRHLGVVGIQTNRARKVEVEGLKDICLDIDGESRGQLDAAFKILPRHLKMLV